jgi:hypothetical protein
VLSLNEERLQSAAAAYPLKQKLHMSWPFFGKSGGGEKSLVYSYLSPTLKLYSRVLIQCYLRHTQEEDFAPARLDLSINII